MIFLVSMVPLIELRGAVPIAVGMNLPLLPSYIICILGNMLPVPIIFFFARKVLEWGADKPVIGKFFTFCLEKGHKGGQKLQEKAGRGLFVALLLFVGIPLPRPWQHRTAQAHKYDSPQQIRTPFGGFFQQKSGQEHQQYAVSSYQT